MTTEERKARSAEKDAGTNRLRAYIGLAAFILSVALAIASFSANDESSKGQIINNGGKPINITGGTVTVYQPADHGTQKVQSSELVTEIEGLKSQVRAIQEKFLKGESVYMQYEGIIRYLGNYQSSATNTELIKRLENAKKQLKKVK